MGRDAVWDNMKTILETPRLILREIDPIADFEPWADCFSDSEVMAITAAYLLVVRNG